VYLLKNIINYNNVSYSYPNADEEVLKNIDLNIKEAKFTVIMGPTGAGKTTLVSCLNGLIPQLFEGKLTGEITVAGQNISNFRVQTLVKYIGLVLQDAETQIFGRTVEEDTAFGPRNFSIPKEEISNRVDEALSRVRLDGYKKRNTGELSGGEKQRLAIAGVLAMMPKILVLDEPTSELDPIGRMEIYTTIDDLRKENRLTLIGIEHSSQEIIDKADELIVINNCSVVWQGEPKLLFRDIEKLNSFCIKPIPVSIIGWSLYKKGLIEYDQIPLDIDEAELIIRRLFTDRKAMFTGCSIDLMASTTLTDDRPILQIKDVDYHYSSGKLALKKINLDINQGEFIALIGQNGAGKTTLAKHLNGLLKPTAGQVIINKKNSKDFELAQLAKEVGYVFQNPDHQIFCVTVEKEIEYGLKNAGFSAQEIKERTERVLELTSLTKFRNAHPFSLGKGERQMIAVASILAIEPKILVVDEPTTGLDWNGINRMMELIKTLHKNGTTIIMITHDMDIVAKYAERIIVMKAGQVLMDGRTREVFSEFQQLKSAYVMPPQIPLLSLRLKDLGMKDIALDEQELTTAILESLEG
jgi:energy-coupling factor transport system ATP-binding protein